MVLSSSTATAGEMLFVMSCSCISYIRNAIIVILIIWSIIVNVMNDLSTLLIINYISCPTWALVSLPPLPFSFANSKVSPFIVDTD